MLSPSWNEVRNRAIKFAREWAGTTSENAEKQTFWNEFFEVFGIRRRSVASFEEPVRNIKGKYSFIDLFWPGVVLIEHKSSGQDLGRAQSQAFRYIQDLAREGRHEEIPRYVIVSDFARFALHDLEPENQKELPLFDKWRVRTEQFTLSELRHHVREFAFLKGEKPVHLNPEDPVNEKAYQIMADLHDTLEGGGFTGHELERFLVRVLFCLFAEDTGIFEPAAFQGFLEHRTREDGTDLGAQLNRLFEVLNTPEEKRQRTLDEDLAALPYVNGALFAERLGFADFNRDMRHALVACCRFQWARISPAVFGSLFQGIMDDKERRQQGAHYTSERDIMKVVRSLFLDQLRLEFDTLKADRSTRRGSRLKEFHDKLRSLKFLDPACGCGNFLILTYRELRRLELDVLRILHRGEDNQQQQVLDVRDLCKVDVDQFYGIELSEWPVRIAEMALWLMDHQMNVEVAEAFGQSFRRLPLKSTPHIIQRNALQFDWNTVLPREQCNYILGNPPFVGKHLMTSEQGKDMESVWGQTDSSGVLDYVTGWYRKAAEFIHEGRIVVGFVSTNSISQGEQVSVLWTPLFKRFHLKIHFAHRTFSWESEACGKAHVHVVIIGFAAFDTTNKRIYDYEAGSCNLTGDVPNISPYLIEGSDTALPSRTDPLANVPACVYGSKPVDGGHLIVEEQQRQEFLANNPGAEAFLRPLLCAEEYLNNVPRWCLWLVDVPPHRFRNISGIRDRLEAVRGFRLSSKKKSTREKAKTSALFAEIRQPTTRFIVVPLHTSENRRYVPFGYFEPDHIIHNSCSAIPNATLFHFGALSSVMHMAWVRQVCGRLESRYRYSNKLVYNNFPWPSKVDTRHQVAVETAAQAVLDARALFLPPKGNSTLADLYDPLSMPTPLAQAHANLDRAVDRCYRSEPFRNDRERVEYLFALYEQLTTPLHPIPRAA